MLKILAISGPIYLAILAGFMATRLGVFQKSDMRVLGKFVLNFALPTLLFNALSQRPLREVLHADYLAAYALAAMVVLVLGYAWARWISHCEDGFGAYFAMGVSSSNSGYMGYPVVVMVIGSSAAVALALNMVVENMLVLPLLFAMTERGQSDGSHGARAMLSTMARLLRNPMIAAILIGFVFSLMGWHLPEPIARTVNMFSQATSAIALFVIGGTLVGLQIHGKGLVIAQISMGKLIVHPMIMLMVITWLIPIGDPALRTAAILFTAMPMLGIYSLLAAKHGFEEVTAATLLSCTLASFFTLNVLLWYLQPH